MGARIAPKTSEKYWMHFLAALLPKLVLLLGVQLLGLKQAQVQARDQSLWANGIQTTTETSRSENARTRPQFPAADHPMTQELTAVQKRTLAKPLESA